MFGITSKVVVRREVTCLRRGNTLLQKCKVRLHNEDPHGPAPSWNLRIIRDWCRPKLHH